MNDDELAAFFRSYFSQDIPYGRVKFNNKRGKMSDVKYKGRNLNDLSRVELIEALEQASKEIQYLHDRIIKTHKLYDDFTFIRRL